MNRRSLFISNFNKKTIFWIKAVIIFFSIIVFCAVMAEQFEENYCAAVIDKAERLRSIEGPKLVLLGDSNVVLGVDSRQLEEAFGMPVVNMALHAGIGNVFHERMARLNVAKGDVYIYAPCSFDDKDKIEDPVLAWTAIGNHWELFNLIPEHDRWRMVKSFGVIFFIKHYPSKSRLFCKLRKKTQIVCRNLPGGIITPIYPIL